MDLSIVILAGGKSRRMGRDKGLIEIQEKAMITHIIDTVAPLNCETFISTSNAAYNSFGLPVIEDRLTDIGPIGGIHAALSTCSTAYVLILTCDSPFITEPLIQSLIKGMAQNKSIVYLQADHSYPLTAIYHQRMKQQIEDLIAQGNYRVRDLLLGDHALPINVSESDRYQLQNINTPDDLAAFEGNKSQK